MSHIHILAPSGHYIGQTRRYGCRRWETVTGKSKSWRKALSNAVLKMRHEDKRARVLFISSSGYYDPILIAEASK